MRKKYMIVHAFPQREYGGYVLYEKRFIGWKAVYKGSYRDLVERMDSIIAKANFKPITEQTKYFTKEGNLIV